MKTIRPPDNDDVFEVFRELGADEFARTPAHRLGRRLQRLTGDAKALDAGAEEKGLLTGFLEALAGTSDDALRKMGLSVSRGATVAPKSRQDIAVAVSSGQRIFVGMVAP